MPALPACGAQAARRRPCHVRRRVAAAALASVVAAQLLPGPAPFSGCFSGTAPARHAGLRARGAPARALATARRAREPRYSTDKLRAETEDPFAKVRLFFFGAGFVSTASGFLFILPRFIGASLGAPNASPVGSVATDLAINAAGAALFAFLAFSEYDASTKREQAKEEGGLIAGVEVWLRDGEKASLVKLSGVRNARGLRARRPVLCIGSLDFCRQCVESSAQRREELDRADFLVVPLLTDGDRSPLVEASEGLSYVALPSQDRKSWGELCRQQLDQVRSQGLDEGDGLVIIVKKNGRVGTRFLGVPNWDALAGEVSARVSAGLDTRNI